MMADPAQPQAEISTHSTKRQGPNLAVWIGPVVVLAGALTYFMFFARFPALRDFPWVNLPIVVFGLLISAHGVRRAFAGGGRSLLARAFAGSAFLASLAVSLLFCAYVFFLSYQLPETDGVVQVAHAVPEFSLSDQNGETIKLSSLLGRKVVLTFYRGHW